MKLLFRLLIILLVTSCSNNVTKGNITDCDSFPADPIAYIYLQPYDNFTQQEATKLASKITEGLSKVYGGDWTNVKVLANKDLPRKSLLQASKQVLS